MTIDAFGCVLLKHNEYTLEIYGDGPLKNELIDYAKEKCLNEKVIFHGSSKQLHEDILNAKVFVISSDYEGMSNSMLEAMALGIPTISTDVPSGGARAVIRDHKNGILVPVRDVRALSDSINEIIDDDILANVLSENGQSIRKSLNINKIAGMWMEYFMAVAIGRRTN
jgi:glycosyltransferase involved in cell wall biosynthesis